jgi:hypothetical protein
MFVELGTQMLRGHGRLESELRPHVCILPPLVIQRLLLLRFYAGSSARDSSLIPVLELVRHSRCPLGVIIEPMTLLTLRRALQVAGALTDNAAALQQRVTTANNPFLATLAAPGEAQFLTAQKPCSILLPHTHQRANEFYSVIFGELPRMPCVQVRMGVLSHGARPSAIIISGAAC